MKQKLHIKSLLLQACRNAIEQRITVAEHAMLDAQQSANSEEKSSAGDKYETGRAMSQIERDRCARQLVEAQQELARLNKIDPTYAHNYVATGALVECDNAMYFIAAAIGQLTIDGMVVQVISPASPLARTFAGKRSGETIVFNQKQLAIKNVH